MRLICSFIKWLALLLLLAPCQSGHVQEAKRHLRAELRDVLGHPSYQGSHWHSGHRVHRLRMPHAHQRWTGRRRSINHHHPFSRWSQWTTCDEDCIRRRERFCKAKRKCGHTKHVEQHKCLHCHPAVKWHSTSNVPQPNFPAHYPNSPPIIINAAAAAAGGSSYQPHPTATYAPAQLDPHPQPQPPSYFEPHPQPQPQPHPHPHPSRHPLPDPYPTSDEESVEVVHRKPPNWPSIETSTEEQEEDDEAHPPFQDDEGDFFVLKRHRRRQRPRHSSRHSSEHNSRQRNRQKPRLDYIDGYSRQRHRQRPRVDHTEDDSRQRHRQRPRFEDIDDDFEDYLEGKSLNIGQRSLGSVENGGLEGDIFQYEDFDFEPEVQYPDSEEFTDARNISWLPPGKERNTPEGLMPRHRRLYSKWSRWTKCSPKCTTRRYKKCRISEQCGREVLREIAYCYTENSFCQQWLQAQVQKVPAYESRPGPVTAMRRMHTEPGSGSLSRNEVNVIMSGKGYRGPEYTPMKLQCGLVRTGHRNMYNLLKIIGGKAARKGEWPWQVAIFNRFKEAFCGGTLIAPLWVLTAAHCVRKVLYVRFGEHNLDYEDGTEVQLRVLKSYKHPSFDKRTVDSDVALLRLPKPVNATSWIGYSCLPRPYQPLPKNVDCTVIGWGKRRNRDVVGTSVLHQADVPIIPMENCRSVYHDYTITKNMFCAGHRRGRIDTCAGDSGGPLLCRDSTKANHPWTIFGITSFGDGCAKRNKFGIYAKVPNYVDWVWSVVNCNGNCKLH
ncbi:hypothetical protein AWZ03_003303 [Drosophila navojoa]|uniref:limulus clotting factor C n=1 Tax=Drosophila navojoa TaxID=7232 RepID=A0A484BNS5_DRONA|nr:uncharacterized protein LOC108651526 isoform X1 [Drosophila navojoa]XP_030238264.1 uncharacterized protein LOC108651526 isoform X1 [Drosophila navojoa]XP_030238266.1 uncharacterized protein LOC108651526 isoform X1 [Drosophila navojoa]TDG50398.1 hypothetical protein AWZ03_003303 [Drosophila navojoa]